MYATPSYQNKTPASQPSLVKSTPQTEVKPPTSANTKSTNKNIVTSASTSTSSTYSDNVTSSTTNTSMINASQQMQTQLLKKLIEDCLQSFRIEIHSEIQNMHLELLREFEEQRV